MDFVKRKFLRRTAFTSSEGDIVYQSWLLQLPPSTGLKKYLTRTHWRWIVLRYKGPQEGVMEMYTNASCERMTSKIRVTRKYKVESGMSFNPGVATNQLNMFCLRTDRQAHYLVAETQAEAEQWVLAICTTCGLDIPRRPKSPSPTEFLLEHHNPRPRAKSESLLGKSQLLSRKEQNFGNRDANYILLSECYVAKEQTPDNEQLPKKDEHLPEENRNLFLSNNNLNYDHPRPINQRLRFLTSPDLREIPPRPQKAGCPKHNCNSQCLGVDIETGGKLLNRGNLHLPIVPVSVNSNPYDTPPMRVIPALQQTHGKPTNAASEEHNPQQTDTKLPNASIERARAEARQAALDLEETISQNSVTEILHGSISPVSSEVFSPDFFPFDIHPAKPPPRPPKPPHLRSNVNLWDGHMIQVDVACPIYDFLPKPRPVLNLRPDDRNGKSDCTMAINNDCENKESNKNENKPKHGPVLRSISANIEIPSHSYQLESSAIIKISPNTRVSRPAGNFWNNYGNCLYDVPKPPNMSNESSSSSTEATKGVIMRRRPPTPPSQNLKHSLFPVDIDRMPVVDSSNKKRMSLTDGQVQPLTQKQRISICNEVNYLDLAFTAEEGECNPKPLARETVYYSVDFIKTWAFNETRQNVEEIYRNT